MHVASSNTQVLYRLTITSSQFPSKRVDFITAGKDIASVLSEILPDASVQTMTLCFG
jgi:hypothetical protein